MTRSEEPDRQASSKPKSSPLEEALRILEEYARDLREIIEKLRQRLH
ncbi:hypothetical protein ACWGQQ_43755 [Bradyrhizobium sp. Lot33]